MEEGDKNLSAKLFFTQLSMVQGPRVQTQIRLTSSVSNSQAMPAFKDGNPRVEPFNGGSLNLSMFLCSYWGGQIPRCLHSFIFMKTWGQRHQFWHELPQLCSYVLVRYIFGSGLHHLHSILSGVIYPFVDLSDVFCWLWVLSFHWAFPFNRHLAF